MDYVDLQEFKIPEAVIELVPESVARENAVLPLAEEDGSLKVVDQRPVRLRDHRKTAVHSQPQDRDRLGAPRERSSKRSTATTGRWKAKVADSMLQEFTDTAIDFTETGDDGSAGGDDAVDENSAPVVRLGATDDQRSGAAAGLGHPHRAVRGPRPDPLPDRRRAGRARQPPATAAGGDSLAVSRFLPRWTSPNGAAPRTAASRSRSGEKELDLRVSIIPTNHGQSVVMRILDKDNIKVGIRAARASARTTSSKFQQLIKRPNGIFLVTGPTGSGKTTTLYAALND